ncbi:MAG: hypothetical protein ACYTF1_00945 [Planctomycetota bacterium]|jgi:hypothetical protein
MFRQIAGKFILVMGYIALLDLASCQATDFRDAALAGVLDFISGTVTDSLTAFFPLANMLSGG